MSKIYYPRGLDIPRELYFSTIWFIRGYDRMKEEAEELLIMPLRLDGMPKGNGKSDPTYAAAERRASVLKDIKAIEDALEEIPEEYRTAVFENVAHQVPEYKLALTYYSTDSTLQRWRVRFIIGVARNRGLWNGIE